MSGLRAWILVLAVASFAAGAGSGVLAARTLAPRESLPHSGTFAEYEALFARTFELTPERREALRAVLASYEADIARIKDRRMADYMSSIEPELRERGRFYRELVRDRVLPEARRAEFDRMAFGLHVPTNP
ncbi:MAG: hypothetical protein JNK02_08030 [Planctomycetes bacterium]|nr:hypothetical protein [Planctomycetota bacterium]